MQDTQTVNAPGLFHPELLYFRFGRRLNSAVRLLAIAVACLAVMADSASGQSVSAIVGVVRDPTGSVVPGTAVEATSPALIEGKRSTVTDNNGQYQIADLRPGDYTVTFSRDGFTRMQRTGIVLTAAFTATVNADLSIGQTTEQVNVTAAAPLVDVQNSLAEQVIGRQRLDVLPTGRDPFAVGQLVAGVTTATPDVAGTGGMQQPTLQVHGSAANDNVFVVDGLQIQHVAFSGNQTGFYFNDGLMQEIGYQTSALPAEAPVGGVQINMIQRDGGNQFHGAFFGSGANQSLQSNNQTAGLLALGLTAPNHIKSVYDVNASLGGPVIKDRIWFFTTFRRWGANNFLANTFTPTGAQALDDNRLTDITMRLSFQVNKNNKASISYDRGFKWRGHRFNNFISASFSDPIADVVQTNWLNYMLIAKWTSTVTSRLVLDVGYARLPVNYNLGFEPGVAPGTIAAYDIVTSTISRTSPREDFDTGLMQTWTASASYISGSHNLKAGFQERTGFFQESFIIPGDMVQILSNGAPNSVRLYNTPLAHREALDPDLGFFIQDSWRVRKRLSLNLGLRFDHMVMNIPAQGAPGGTWVGPRSFPAINGVVDWNTVSPRLGFAWDVFGDAKTALKGGVSRFDRLEGTTLAQNVNPNFIATNTCPLTSNVLPTSLSQLTGCTGFVGGTSLHIDPNLKRPYQWEYTLSIQRQVTPSTSVMLGYYGRKFYDLYGTINQAVPPSAYIPVPISNPLTGQLMVVYNQDPATRGQFNLLQTTLPYLHQMYNGMEIQFNSRLSSRATVFGGFTVGRSYGTPDGGSDYNNPNVRENWVGNIGYDSTFQIRAGGSYQLPLGIRLSGALREASGLPQSRGFTVTQSLIPNLTQVTQAVIVSPPGSFRYPWQNLLDMRISKAIRIRERFRIEPVADLYNVFNSSAVTSAVTTVGPSLLKPSNIDMGRLLRLGGHFEF